MIGRKALLELGSVFVYDNTISALKCSDKKLIWHVAMPKSGCTWLTMILHHGLSELNWQTINLVPDAKRREQVVTPTELLRQKALNVNVFAAQQHCLFSEHALSFLSNFNVHLVLQVRNVYDCIVSYVDHLNNESVIIPAIFLTETIWQELSAEQKLQFVVDNIVPWYIQFWVSWTLGLEDTEVSYQIVHYENLLVDTENEVYKVARNCSSQLTKGDVAKWLHKPTNDQTRKNKAVRGRGQHLPQWVFDKVEQLTSYYPNVDFEPIGITSK